MSGSANIVVTPDYVEFGPSLATIPIHFDNVRLHKQNRVGTKDENWADNFVNPH